MTDEPHELWVFAYGSLMWRPGFSFIEATPATLTGYRRAFSVYSVHYRGTADRPGLVLGLERGGVCHGLAFRVAGADAANVLAGLRSRELVYGVYREVLVPVSVRDGDGWQRVEAVTYVAESNHVSHAGDLALAKQASLVRSAKGRSGTNLEYVAETMRSLSDNGIDDPVLSRLSTVLGLNGWRSLKTVPVTALAKSRQASWSAKRGLGVRVPQARLTALKFREALMR